VIDLTGRVAVVVGAGSGIGRATALRFAALGATVAVADLDFDAASETARSAGSSGGGDVRPYFLDVTDQATIDEARDGVLGDLGAPRIVVNAAGWDSVGPFLDTDRALWEKLVALNLVGTIAVVRAFLDAMIERGDGGRVVTVASDAGRVGSSGETVYAGAKGGIIAFSKSLAREMARHSILVNCVCPGPTDTPLFASLPERTRAALERAIPLRRLARPEEVAAAIAFFASDEASFTTGQVLSVSGGLTMHG
jgi:2-hydroxycyclohexanecarboxyl-CoA dehydrogenase